MGEPAQPGLELGLGLTLPQPRRDPAEPYVSPVALTTATPSPALTTVPMNA